MQIQYNGKSKILRRIVALVNRSQNIALRQDNTDKNTLYWTGLDGVEITVTIPSGAVEVDAELSETSTNPVENQAITKELAKKADKSAIPTVGNGVLSVQRNGKSVGTFSANAAENVSINIPVPEKASELENDAGYGTYTKPSTGIPKSDLASGVQASLGKADTALQKHQDISGKVDNTAAGADSLLSKITNSWTATPTDNTYFIRQDTSSKNEFGRVKFSTLWSYIKSKVESLGYTKNTGTITGIKMNGASKGTSGVVDLGTVITAHQDISGKQDKSTAVTHTANTAVGSATKPVYVAANGVATAISHAINADVPANAKFTDTVYTHPTTSGNKHIPAGGSSGQILRWSADGTAVWGADAFSTGHMTYGYAENSTAAANSGYTWARVAYCETAVGYDTITMTLLVTSGYAGAGLFSVFYRNSSTGKACDNIGFEQIFTNKPTKIANDYFKFIAVYTDSGVRYEIWYNIQTRWSSAQFTCLAEQAYAGVSTNKWKFEKRNGNTFVTAPPIGNKEATYYNNGVVNTATTLTDSGWTAMTVEGYYAKSGTVKYRTYGKQITITGSVVLKNDIATSYPAPQDIASTTFDFSKIVGCSGVGRSSSGVGAYVGAENYNGDNLVCVYALGSKIAAGSTLYFTITGFID